MARTKKTARYSTGGAAPRKHPRRTLALDSGDVSEDDAPPQPPPLNANLLSWRMPPEESLSDWTIQILITEDESTTTTAGNKKEPPLTTTFHVHRALLAVGPKKLLYFQTLFQNSNFTESETKTSKIKLNAIATAAFPCMLDFLYSPDDELEVTTSNATGLYFLGQYFECHRLHWEAFQFCTRNISVDNCGTYYEQAKAFCAENITTLVVKIFCKYLWRIDVHSQLLKVSDVALWKSIIRRILNKGLSPTIARTLVY